MWEPPIQVDMVKFETRRARTCYAVNQFGPHMKGPLLDIGCRTPVIPEVLPDIDYTGVDMCKEADVQLDLEEVDRLPFETGEFGCVLCADTLEHLDNLHHIFGELVRVAREKLIVSLPNNWGNARVPIQRGRGSIGHYGLPVDPPEDRHKWFFGLSEAAEFMRSQTKKYPVTLVKMVANEKPRPFLFRWIRRMRYPRLLHYLNRYSHTLWAVYEKVLSSTRKKGWC